MAYGVGLMGLIAGQGAGARLLCAPGHPHAGEDRHASCWSLTQAMNLVFVPLRCGHAGLALSIGLGALRQRRLAVRRPAAARGVYAAAARLGRFRAARWPSLSPPWGWYYGSPPAPTPTGCSGRRPSASPG
ncbi:MAG: hypothetical protein MZW92_28725 [Comamonadaceae bacterium]|nr:hypothetical protein [Comamonadaceae bacterium]